MAKWQKFAKFGHTGCSKLSWGGRMDGANKSDKADRRNKSS